MTAVRGQPRDCVAGYGGKGDEGVVADDGGRGTGQTGAEQRKQRLVAELAVAWSEAVDRRTCLLAIQAASSTVPGNSGQTRKIVAEWLQ